MENYIVELDDLINDGELMVSLNFYTLDRKSIGHYLIVTELITDFFYIDDFTRDEKKELLRHFTNCLKDGEDGALFLHHDNGENCVKYENHTEHSYGGLKYIRLWFGYRFLMASLEDKIVDTMNMNFCLISKEAVNAIGFLDPVFRHQRADLDYGLRLRAYGGIIYNITSPVCLCDRNEFESNSYSSNTSYFKKIRSIFSIKEQPVKERFVFYRRYGGWAWIIGFMAPYFTVFMPFFHTLCKRLSVRKTGRLL